MRYPIKDTIEWHERNLANFNQSLNAKYHEESRIRDEVRRMEDELVFRRHQIAEAKKRGKKSFDGERFCVKRKGNA